ncbi:hypothetical protein CYLTODRAFT_435304 [Cylindrobasidium torrendii FP15055 ss-10]|uniref:Uncharacterized protein n=1 Tax=Cylindrobasidium torrendii FP15055 ss-10 TaxID=1314674 RepID=A0A0D7BNX4_9AGAR|nr:hypothetical protein CYLTODRAFT_435304 [Cylindrobasidium torrendii FP15055 ss-10]
MARALTQKQERRLMDYLDLQFLELARGYKKRSEPTATLSTLPLYLQAASKLLGLILRIPPVGPSISLRTSFMLKLTNDVLCSVMGYPADPQNVAELLDWMDDLDQAWVAVMRAEPWDDVQNGVTPMNEDTPAERDESMDGIVALGEERTSALSQTEKTRLRSLLIGGIGTFEEWMYGETPLDSDETHTQAQVLLEEMGLKDAFDQAFSRTLDELGGLAELRHERIVLRPDTCRMEEVEADEFR